MTDYESLLNTPEWQQKRVEIITRDRGICQRCGTGEMPIQVHHTYYKDTLPWEYDNDALISVCEACHKAIHLTEKIPFLDSEGNPIIKFNKCLRCHGFGFISNFNHIQNGICFRCRGSGVESKGFTWQLDVFRHYAKEATPEQKKQPKTRAELLKLFKSWSIHVNLKGPYIVETIHKSKASIRYADGSKSALRIDVLDRMENELICAKCVLISEDEAHEYVKKHNLHLDSTDPLEVYSAAYKYIEDNKYPFR
jgi:hypothetical protein